MTDPIPLAPEGTPGEQGATAPCSHCGWPLARGAVVCARCGWNCESGQVLQTRVESQLAPAPRPRLPTCGEQAWRIEDGERVRRGLIWLGISAGILLPWYALENGTAELAGLLGRQGVTFAAAFLVLTLARLLVMDCPAGMAASVVGLAAALMGWDLAQHFVHYTLIVVGAWIAGMLVCLGLLADLLDLEIPEAAMLALAILFLKLLLRWTLFGF